MDKNNIEEWATSYISFEEKPTPKNDDDPAWWPVRQFYELVHEKPELCWDAILKILESTSNEEILSGLAAGPLEDLIEEHGPAFIERIEREALQNAKFKKLLRGVWKSSTEQIWERILVARGESTEDDDWRQYRKPAPNQ